MSWGLWKTLLQPDQEELQHPEKTQVARAANVLQIGEFQLLQLAYRDWHGEDLPEALVDRLFHDYMLHNEVPHWARHYSRKIIDLAEEGRIDDRDPSYHDFDHDYQTHMPDGVRKFYLASACLMLFMCGGILLASFSAEDPTSVFPPYFERSQLVPAKPTFDGFGRADSVHPRQGP